MPVLSVEFHNISEVYGVSTRGGSSVCKDETGFIWASSKSGLLRFTEDNCRIYQLPFESADYTNVKLKFRNSVLWACGNNGQIFRYNEITDSFDPVINLSRSLNMKVFLGDEMEVDSRGNLYVASTVGLFRCCGQDVVRIGAESSWVNSLIWFDDHTLLVARGANFFLIDIESFEEKPLFLWESPSSFSVSRLFLDKQTNKLWVGTQADGVYCFDFSSHEFYPLMPGLMPNQPVLAIERNSESTILVGIDGQGIWEFSDDGRSVLNIYKEDSDNLLSLDGNGVYDIFHDEESNRIWVCTFSGGVMFFDQDQPLVERIAHQINNKSSLVNNAINAVIEDSEGNRWFATENGISKYEVKTDTWKSFYANNKEQAQVFLSLCDDGHGRIWAGSYSSGVYLLDMKSGRELAHYSSKNPQSPFVNDFVFDIYKDKSGDVWVCGLGGALVRYIYPENRYEEYAFNTTTTIIDGRSDDNMILANSFGLLQINKATKESEVLYERLTVRDILLHDNLLLVATSGDGLMLLNLDTNKTEMITTWNGLPSNIVNSVTYSDGFFWLGTENGICRFDLAQKTVQSYSSLAQVMANPNAVTIFPNGQLAWGTSAGLILFNPKDIEETAPRGNIYIQDLGISGNSIRDDESFKLTGPIDDLDCIKLKYGQNAFKLQLLSIGALEGSKFSWKLDGVDREWSSPSEYGTIIYSSIPSGKNTLHIMMLDKAMTQVLDERTFMIEMKPPFWRTWWFFAIVFFLVSTIMYLLFWHYIDQLKKRHDEEKIHFFANTAHDMRTALTLIKAPIEELSKEKFTEAGAYNLYLAKEQATRLSMVVTQLMDFQKIDIGKEQMAMMMTDLVPFLSCRVQMFQSMAQHNGVEIRFFSNMEHFSTAIDETMMEKIVDNLISNAVKYSKPQSKIEVSLSVLEERWQFAVKDQGIGISKNDQKHLFKEFYRSENAVNSKIVGSGIGLLLVKKYVDMLQGSIECESREDEGTLFTVSIPNKVVEQKAVSKASETPVAFDFTASTVPLEPEDREESSSAKSMRILVVEDNDDLLGFMRSALSSEFDVEAASDGAEAWNIVQKHQFDLVVSDVMMPNMDGFELCRLIKSTYETAHIPIVLLTSLTEKACYLQGLGFGADDYVTKPFDMSMLKQRIKTIVQNRNLVRDKLMKLMNGNAMEELSDNKFNNDFIQKLQVVVKENISNSGFGKDEFASAMNVSSSLLYKKMKAITGQSPSDFIKTVRLEHALELLKTKEYTMTEVSEMCGFTSAGYFSTVFKKQYSVSPSEFIDRKL